MLFLELFVRLNAALSSCLFVFQVHLLAFRVKCCSCFCCLLFFWMRHLVFMVACCTSIALYFPSPPPPSSSSSPPPPLSLSLSTSLTHTQHIFRCIFPEFYKPSCCINGKNWKIVYDHLNSSWLRSVNSWLDGLMFCLRCPDVVLSEDRQSWVVKQNLLVSSSFIITALPSIGLLPFYCNGSPLCWSPPLLLERLSPLLVFSPFIIKALPSAGLLLFYWNGSPLYWSSPLLL